MNTQQNRHNYIKLRFPALSENEGLARVCVAALASQLDPTLEELSEIRTAVSEAVTNAVVHAYHDTSGEIELTAEIDNNVLRITIKDDGRGIPDVDLAMQPFYSKPESEERSGMGFTVMQTFMDNVTVASQPGVGTIVSMNKRIGHE